MAGSLAVSPHHVGDADHADHAATVPDGGRVKSTIIRAGSAKCNLNLGSIARGSCAPR